MTANPAIKQRVYCITDSQKYVQFVQLLTQLQAEGSHPKIIVFVNMKKSVDYLVK